MSGLTKLDWKIEEENDGWRVCDHSTPRGIEHVPVACHIAQEQEAILMSSAPRLMRLLWQTVSVLEGGNVEAGVRESVVAEATETLQTLIDVWEMPEGEWR